jgi:hypothetical protein
VVAVSLLIRVSERWWNRVTVGSPHRGPPHSELCESMLRDYILFLRRGGPNTPTP